MKHVMLDLETWGTRAGCAIRSIGACSFELDGDGVHWGSTFYQNVTLASCEKMRLHVDHDTAKWWSEQGEAARAVLEHDQVHLKTAVLNFNTWFRCVNPEDIDGTPVWSHGAAFDVPIYEAAACSVGFRPPWHYRATRDTRTLFDLAGFNTKDVPFIGIEHNALDDAVHQARCVQAAMKRIAEWKEQSEEYDEIKGMYGP